MKNARHRQETECLRYRIGRAVIILALIGMTAPLAAEEVKLIADEPWMCRGIEPLIEMAKLATGDGGAMRKNMIAEIEKGECRIGKPESIVNIVAADQRGFLAVEEKGQSGRWWINAEDAWPAEEAAEKLKSWTNP